MEPFTEEQRFRIRPPCAHMLADPSRRGVAWLAYENKQRCWYCWLGNAYVWPDGSRGKAGEKRFMEGRMTVVPATAIETT